MSRSIAAENVYDVFDVGNMREPFKVYLVGIYLSYFINIDSNKRI